MQTSDSHQDAILALRDRDLSQSGRMVARDGDRGGHGDPCAPRGEAKPLQVYGGPLRAVGGVASSPRILANGVVARRTRRQKHSADT